MTDIPELVRRNADFVTGEFRDGPLSMKSTGDMMIIGCVDPRVDPAYIVGLARGEAVVIRNPGGRVTPATLRAMNTLNKVNEVHPENAPDGDFTLVILHHTDCGMAGLVPYEDVLAAYFETSADALGAMSVGDPYGSVRADVEIVRRAVHRPRYVVAGLVYDVATGAVEVVVPPAQVPPPPAPPG
ncbi:carbonic anhydrase [Streptomyces sp. NBC_01498]|uniref:carbonic anhydrase n=1 Tax=Streptomyces sp. NBC_01498 TaxID=2975870 RepID=UPI002E7AEF61|nr:carbonic anhydrase [Streptomyces sp. NBC_01498]WTL26085.1 carbonic anhydrase [Streptomyces sp. NBC_01498]